MSSLSVGGVISLVSIVRTRTLCLVSTIPEILFLYLHLRYGDV